MATQEANQSFPRMVSYIQSLPNGLDSYPECRVKREAHEEMMQKLISLNVVSKLPEALQDGIRGKGDGVWIREAVGNAVLLAGRDAAFASDDVFVKWARANMTNLADRPLYRMLMKIVSPSLAAIGVSKRWAAFHTGTQLTSSPIAALNGRNQVVVSLQHPPKLYNPLLLDQLGAVLAAVAENCRARNLLCSVRDYLETRADFTLSWQG